MKVALVSSAMALPLATAFSTRPAGRGAFVGRARGPPGRPAPGGGAARRFLAADEEGGAGAQAPVVKSGRKEIAYDEASGRFFEVSETECIPEEEFCITDKDTGKMIRLTTEEKERIFLDSLQVSAGSVMAAGVDVRRLLTRTVRDLFLVVCFSRTIPVDANS